MQKMGLNEIREKFLAYFASHGHLRLPSFSLVPRNDPSVLLVNAGMTPLKPYFTGAQTPPAPRVTTCQKCIRTPDIDRVGKTARHGTFFEMLGNFSFGDYFKKEAVAYAWEFLTQVLEMPPDRLHASVYREDDEAYDIWEKEIGLPPDRIVRMGKEDNFWEHGTGPCGPSSEIYFDRGIEKGCGSPTCGVGCACDRFVEIWNLVFTQFNREADGSYTPLDRKNIDTGGGLERFACVMQDVDSLFEVDTIRAILDHVCTIAAVRYPADAATDMAVRVITDHIRSVSFMIADGILPANEGRGYVLRRLLRRAARFGRLLAIEGTFLHRIVATVVRESAQAYPELAEKRDTIETVVRVEEERFAQTIQAGMGVLDRLLNETRATGDSELAGASAFLLHDTYGFPLELTREIAAERGLSIDEAGFAQAMHQQKERARAALQAQAGSAWDGGEALKAADDLPATVFSGYEQLADQAEVLFLATVADQTAAPTVVTAAAAGADVLLVTARTPFYAEAGGQVGDTGVIAGDGFEVHVRDTRSTDRGVFLHEGRVAGGTVRVGDPVRLTVDGSRRLAIARNHTATHLLHKALRRVLGDHVAQAGSLVSPTRLRFDFAHFQPLTPAEVQAVEQQVNLAILDDLQIKTEQMTPDEARRSGAVALFDETYGEQVRVVQVGDYSRELCGGTHLSASSQACLFRIVSESGIAAGVRRIEALTGQAAYAAAQADAGALTEAATLLKTPPRDVPRRVASLLAEQRALEKKLSAREAANTAEIADQLVRTARETQGFHYVIGRIDAPDADTLRRTADRVRDAMGEGVVFLATVSGERILFVAMATPAAVAAGVAAGDLVRAAARVTGGGGGGRPDMAQAGGKDVAKLEQALRDVEARIVG